MIVAELLKRLRASEGWRSRVYLDTTGHLTIGYGLNLGKVVAPAGVKLRIVPVNGIPENIGELLLTHYALKAADELRERLPWFDRLDDVRQEVLAEMAYNLGAQGLAGGWPNFLANVQHGRFERAATVMLGSKWAGQVGSRARELAAMMVSGNRA